MLDEMSDDSLCDDAIFLNGSEVTQDQLLERKEVCSGLVEELFKNNSASVRPSAKERLKQKIHTTCFTLSIIDINIKLFGSEKASAALSGMIRYGTDEQAADSWNTSYYEIDTKGMKFNIFSSPVKDEGEQPKSFPLASNLSFQVYFSDANRFSIIYHVNLEDHFGLYYMNSRDDD